MKAFRQLTKWSVFLLALYLFIMSCNKDDLSLDLPMTPIPVDWTVVSESTSTNGSVTCTTKKVKWGPQYLKLICFDPQGDVIFPGAIFRYEGIKDGGYPPIVGNRKPLTLSASLPNLVNGTSTVEEPSLSSIRQASREILQTLGAGNTPAHIVWKCQEIYSKKHFELAVGGNYGNWFFDIRTEFEFENNVETRRYLLEFEQVYYSIDIDVPPPGLENWFEETPDQSQLGAYSPAYVSSVRYGRKVFLLIESKTLSSGLAAELEADFNTFMDKGSFEIDSRLDKLVNEKSIKAFIMGGSAPEANRVVLDPAALKQYIKKGANYSPSSPGVPLSYTLRFIRDNSIASLNLYDEFEIKECVVDSDSDIISFTPSYTPSDYKPPYSSEVENPRRLFPKHTKGDRYYASNGGPDLTPRCSLLISEDKKKIIAEIRFKAKETKSDWTTGEDEWYFPVYTAPAGKKIDKILTKDKSDPETDKDENGGKSNEIEYPPFTSELVNRYVMLGQTEGIDLGDTNDQPDQTNLRVWFNKVKIKLKD